MECMGSVWLPGLQRWNQQHYSLWQVTGKYGFGNGSSYNGEPGAGKRKRLDNPVVHDTEAPIRTAVEALQYPCQKREEIMLWEHHTMKQKKERLQNEF